MVVLRFRKPAEPALVDFPDCKKPGDMSEELKRRQKQRADVKNVCVEKNNCTHTEPK